MDDYGVERVTGISQIFMKPKEILLTLLIANLTDDFIVTGLMSDVKDFLANWEKGSKLERLPSAVSSTSTDAT